MPIDIRTDCATNDNLPRLLTKKAAAMYCGVSTPTFTKWVLAGTMPPSVGITRMWDRLAINLAIDCTSGNSEMSEFDAFDTWKKAR